MSDDPRTDPSGTLYGTRRPGLPRDPLMRIALGVAVVGVLLGIFFATGVFGGGDGEQPVVPVAATANGSNATPPSTEATPTTEAASTEAAPSPTATPPASAGPKVIQGVPSGRCLGVTGDDPEGADAVLADCTGGPEQQWVLTSVADNIFTLTDAASGKCLEVEGASGDDGAPVQQFSCSGQPHQQWRFTPAGSGPVLLVAVHSDKCAQVHDASTEAGDQLEQAPCSGAPEQQWTLG